tara:strand:+ start:310 stop:543 length:234 start_codon:yes stop_codon:yes gene_type:complete
VDDLQLVLKLRAQIKNSLSALSITVTSGGVDSFEIYKYMLGQINAYEAILQEISNLLETKEQHEKHTGNIVDIQKSK